MRKEKGAKKEREKEGSRESSSMNKVHEFRMLV